MDKPLKARYGIVWKSHHKWWGTVLLIVVCAAAIVPLGGCYRYWIHYNTEPAVIPVEGGEFHFQVWQLKDPNPKYFDTERAVPDDSTRQKLALSVGFDPPRRDSTILVNIRETSINPSDLVDVSVFDTRLLDTTRTYGWMRMASIEPIYIPLYYSKSFTISFSVSVTSTAHPDINSDYSFTVTIQPTKSRQLRILSILEGS